VGFAEAGCRFTLGLVFDVRDYRRDCTGLPIDPEVTIVFAGLAVCVSIHSGGLLDGMAASSDLDRKAGGGVTAPQDRDFHGQDTDSNSRTLFRL